MNRFFFYEWAQLRAQGFFSHQIHCAAEQIFEIELDTEVTIGCCGAVEADQDVQVAIATRGVTRGGSEQSKTRYPVTGRDYGFALGE